MGLYGNMPKLNDLNESEKLRAIVNKDGIVMCLFCEKNPAIVNEYGMLRKCDECERKKDYNVIVSIDEPSGRRSY